MKLIELALDAAIMWARIRLWFQLLRLAEIARLGWSWPAWP